MIDELEIQKMFYRPVCTSSEIDRIFNVQNAQDHLLKLRADTLVDNMRLFRVYRNKAVADEKNWSLERSFDNTHYLKVLEKLPATMKDRCRKVTFGDIFSNDPNGMIFNSEHGVITTISDSLKFFLKFGHLAVLNFDSEVPSNIQLNSLRIAIRTMLKTETMDFLMDPRGIIPSKIDMAIQRPIQAQMQFIAGHEFAHFILGHLSEASTLKQPIFHAISKEDKDYGPEIVFNNSQKNEFEADIKSILLPNYSEEERAELLGSALLWFGCLELYQVASATIFPENPFAYKRHPSSMERYENLLTNIPTPKSFDLSIWKKIPGTINELSKWVQEDISLNIDVYETYGSVYLDEPNTEWRGKELIDRVDYY